MTFAIHCSHVIKIVEPLTFAIHCSDVKQSHVTFANYCSHVIKIVEPLTFAIPCTSLYKQLYSVLVYMYMYLKVLRRYVHYKSNIDRIDADQYKDILQDN